MSKRLMAVLALLAGTTALAVTASAETVRIEPRPYTGAMVTLEQGVRVFRPLPPTNRVIINPNGATPLSLGFNDTRVYEYRRSYNYHKHEYDGRAASQPSFYGGYSYPAWGYGNRGGRGGYGHGRGHGGGGSFP